MYLVIHFSFIDAVFLHNKIKKVGYFLSHFKVSLVLWSVLFLSVYFKSEEMVSQV